MENLPTSGCKSVALISRNVLKVVNDCCMAALDCHYNIVHVLSSPQTTTTGVGVAKCWADLEILAQI